MRPIHTAGKLPCWALIVDLNVNWKMGEQHLAHFHSLIRFTGQQSHLRNHGDADKVTHDYSSVVPPDWSDTPPPPLHTHWSSQCPCSTSLCPSGGGSITDDPRLFFTSGLVNHSTNTLHSSWSTHFYHTSLFYHMAVFSNDKAITQLQKLCSVTNCIHILQLQLDEKLILTIHFSVFFWY